MCTYVLSAIRFGPSLLPRPYEADPVVTCTDAPPLVTFYPGLGWTCGKWQNMVKSTYLHGADLAQSKKWKGKILFIFYVVFRENRRFTKDPGKRSL